MKIKSTLLGLACTALMQASAHAVLSLSISYMPTLADGSDPNGFDGSTWTFVMTSNQTTYGGFMGSASVTSDSMTLTITGADNVDYNDSFALSEATTTNFIAIPNYISTQFFSNNTNGNTVVFTFGTPGITVQDFSPFGATVAVPAPSIGDPIEASDFEGAALSVDYVAVGDGFFDFSNGTMSAVVPEPATNAALCGLAALGLALIIRRRRAE